MDLLFSLLIIAVLFAFFESKFGKSTKSDGTQDAPGTTSTKVSGQPESQVTRRLMDGRSKGESPPKRPSPPVRSTTAGHNQIGAGLQRDSSADQQRSSVLIESRAKTYSRKFPNVWRRVERLTTEVLGSEVAVASSGYRLQFSGEQITRMVGHLDREFEIEIDKTRSVIAKSGTTAESRAIASAPLHSVESLFVAVVECLSPDGEKNGVIGWFENRPVAMPRQTTTSGLGLNWTAMEWLFKKPEDVSTAVSGAPVGGESARAREFLERAEKLKMEYPEVFAELRNWWNENPQRDRTFEESADKVYTLGQLWLTWFDGDDFQFTKDRRIYDGIVSLAKSPPRCSVEDEAIAHLRIVAGMMTQREISIALKCPIETVGWIVAVNGQLQETENDLRTYAKDRFGTW